MPGLGKQPQPPSSEAPAAPPVAAPGVRSEPRLALDPVPRPPPSGGSVKPGGEGGGGGNPTRDGVGGGGGPAGGELAANTFPMVSARGRVRGQRSGVTHTPGCDLSHLPPNSDPVLTGGGGACSRPGVRSYPVRSAQPNPLPPPRLFPRPMEPIGSFFSKILPSRSKRDFLLEFWKEVPPTSLKHSFLLVLNVNRSVPLLCLSHWLAKPMPIGSRPRGSETGSLFVDTSCFATPTCSLPHHPPGGTELRPRKRRDHWATLAHLAL